MDRERLSGYDAVIIGGGCVGTAIAWYLSRYDIRICLVEKESDISEGTTKANSGIVHAGYDPLPGSLKATLNVRGNSLIHQLAQQLSLDFRPNGALVIAFSAEEVRTLEGLLERGRRNGVPGISILSRSEVLSREPNLSPGVQAALFLPTSGIICPFSLAYAFAENARDNGTEIRLREEVLSIQAAEGGFDVRTSRAVIRTRCVVNAAGLYADEVHAMAAGPGFSITPRRGEYVLLDKSEAGIVGSTIFQVPTAAGKGVLVTPTVHGNIMCGPDNIAAGGKDDLSTVGQGLAYVMASAARSVPSLDFRKVITSFAGLRAHPDSGDFIIGMPVPGFIDAAGIESPGLSASPAIGEMAGSMAAEYLGARRRRHVIEERKGIVRPASLPMEERRRLIASDPLYGNIVCRCEEVSEGEIVEAIRRGAATLDGVKRRVRAGMGRCQSGFCMPRVMEILSRETGIPMEDICRNGEGSEVII